MKFPDIKKHLRNFRVGIAGAGGLGSNCAVALARTGVGTILICDNDIIESGNLNRQYYFSIQIGLPKVEAIRDNIAIIDKEVNIITNNIELTPYNIPEIFAGCDVIVEALDLKEMKEMFIETVQKEMPRIPLITGSGLAGWGDTGSLRCRKIDETLYVCGDESTEVSDELPPLAPRVGIVANLQADKVIEVLMKKRQ
ncbi:MAG TPA: sulfur carrier protein ThiS adenylyltransferase ThiF [Bacteroidales bacterium]|nr:sulfur carrier protein ThiS adenylyltransferase ThiF [Bacteroidales bacterium]